MARRRLCESLNDISRTRPLGCPADDTDHIRNIEKAMPKGRNRLGPGPCTRFSSCKRKRSVAAANPVRPSIGSTAFTASRAMTITPTSMTSPSRTSVQVTAQKPP